MTDLLIPTIAVEGASAPLAPTPTQVLVQDANAVAYGTDARGRKIGVRRINLSVRRRLLKALSSESVNKQQYFNLAVMAASCVELNGEAIQFPTSEMQVDALIDRLDDDGFEAISTVLVENFMPKAAAA